MERNYLGIEIGGTKIQIFIVNTSYIILERIKFFVGDKKEASKIQKVLEKNLNKILSEWEITAIGLGFGGPIDYNSGFIHKSFHVHGWDHFNIKKWLSNITNIPVFVDNDGNIAALGEAILGAGKGLGRVFYITLGSGAGGGFVVDGKIYHGNAPGEFEVGHLRLSKAGETMESSVSAWALNKKLSVYIDNNPHSQLAVLVKKNETDATKNLMAAINGNDFEAKAILDETIDDLAYGLSHVVHIVNPNILILGGGLSNLGDYLSITLTQKLRKYVMEVLKQKLPAVKLSGLKEDTVPMGAVVLAIQQTKKCNSTKQ